MATITTIIQADDILEYVPGADVTLDDKTLSPYLRPAHKIVATIIGDNVFNRIASLKSSDLLDDLKAAVANRLMYDYKLFESIQKKQSEINIYKYELQAMQETYLGFYYDALDSLIKGLNAAESPVPEWMESPASKARQELLIRDADEFNHYYGIDGSDYFFWSAIFLQRRVIDKHISSIALDKLDENLVRRVKGITAMMTVGYALRQFDMSMLPKSLRNPTQEGALRNGSSEQSAMYNLSDYLLDQGEKDLAQIIFELNKPEPGSDAASTTELNSPDKKFFLFQ